MISQQNCKSTCIMYILLTYLVSILVYLPNSSVQVGSQVLFKMQQIALKFRVTF